MVGGRALCSCSPSLNRPIAGDLTGQTPVSAHRQASFFRAPSAAQCCLGLKTGSLSLIKQSSSGQVPCEKYHIDIGPGNMCCRTSRGFLAVGKESRQCGQNAWYAIRPLKKQCEPNQHAAEHDAHVQGKGQASLQAHSVQLEGACLTEMVDCLVSVFPQIS